MFATLESFSVFFFISLAIIILMIWNEEKIEKNIERRLGNVKRKQSKACNRTNRR